MMRKISETFRRLRQHALPPSRANFERRLDRLDQLESHVERLESHVDRLESQVVRVSADLQRIESMLTECLDASKRIIAGQNNTGAIFGLGNCMGSPRVNRPPVHFLTFGGGGEWQNAARRLTEQAKATGLFASASYETSDRIFQRWPEFSVHRPFIEANPRGWGYWLWKPFLARKYMDSIEDGEVLFFLDAGCEILPQHRYKLDRLLGLFNDIDHMLLDYSDYPVFNIMLWAKQSLLSFMEKEFGLIDIASIPKTQAGTFALAKTKNNISLLDDWFRIATMGNYHFIDDSLSKLTQEHMFFEHRHDQSILSLLASAYGMKACGRALDYDYTNFPIGSLPVEADKPFLVLRNCSAVSKFDNFQQLPEPAINWRPTTTRGLAEKLTCDNRQELERLGLLQSLAKGAESPGLLGS